MNKFKINKLILTVAALSMFANFALATFHAPKLIILVTFVFRDLVTLALLIILIRFSDYGIRLMLLLCWILTSIIFAVSFIVFDQLPFIAFVEKFRNIYTIPILSFLIISRKRYDTNVFPFVYAFGALCLFEAIFIITLNGNLFLELINFHAYMNAKGTQVGYAFGIFGQHRLLTPMFQPSLGGVILACTIIILFRHRRYYFGVILILPLILSLSKTGIVILVIYGFIYILPNMTLLGVAIAPFLLIDLVGIWDTSHTASILYHFKGYFEGFEYFLEPQGVGNTGTVGALTGRQVGAESGIGAFLAAFGFYGFFPILLAIVSKREPLYTVFIISILFTEITMNLYVLLMFLLMISQGKVHAQATK